MRLQFAESLRFRYFVCELTVENASANTGNPYHIKTAHVCCVSCERFPHLLFGRFVVFTSIIRIRPLFLLRFAVVVLHITVKNPISAASVTLKILYNSLCSRFLGCTFMVLPPMGNWTHLARRERKNRSWVRFSGMTLFFFLRNRCQAWNSAYYSVDKKCLPLFEDDSTAVCNWSPPKGRCRTCCMLCCSLSILRYHHYFSWTVCPCLMRNTPKDGDGRTHVRMHWAECKKVKRKATS